MVECLVVQQNKVQTTKTSCLLQPLDILGPCKEEVSMDFVTSIPKSKGNNDIMVVVDRLTKYEHFYALSHPFSASIVVSTFMDAIQNLHGDLKIIVSDRDLIFTGKFCTKLFLCLST